MRHGIHLPGLAVLLACHGTGVPAPQPSQGTVVVETTTVAVPFLGTPDGLSTTTARRLGLRLAAIRVEPDTVFLNVGDELAFAAFRVLALDSAGGVLGRLAFYDYGMAPGAVELTRAMHAIARARGTGLLRITVAESYWGGGDRPRPSTTLPIVVR